MVRFIFKGVSYIKLKGTLHFWLFCVYSFMEGFLLYKLFSRLPPPKISPVPSKPPIPQPPAPNPPYLMYCSNRPNTTKKNQLYYGNVILNDWFVWFLSVVHFKEISFITFKWFKCCPLPFFVSFIFKVDLFYKIEAD